MTYERFQELTNENNNKEITDRKAIVIWGTSATAIIFGLILLFKKIFKK